MQIPVLIEPIAGNDLSSARGRAVASSRRVADPRGGYWKKSLAEYRRKIDRHPERP